MSFVGKILVVMQLLLSVCFMAFAGAVHSTHINWKNEAKKQTDQVSKLNTDLNTVRADFEKFKDSTAANLKNAEARAGVSDASAVGLKQQVDQLLREKSDLNRRLGEAQRLATISGEEAVARRNESIQLRLIRQQQSDQLIAEAAQRTQLEDQLASASTDLSVAIAKNKELIGTVGQYQRFLDLNRLEFDPKEVAGSQSTPPNVDGKVLATRAAKSSGSAELIQLSLGSDQGLLQGHEMVVYRSGVASGTKAKYLAKVRIVEIYPDQATAEVIERGPNGAIQKGDDVTTKL